MKLVHDLTTDKKLKIIQDTDLNGYTFDSLVLSYFSYINKRTVNVVDLCTGNAPIALLLSRRKKMNIIGVEIQKDVYDMAVESVKLNKLEQEIKLYNENLISISNIIGKNKYQLVTCNPPYFKVDEDSNLNSSSSVAMARHELSVNFEEIVVEVKKLLDNMGRFCFIHRPNRLDEIIVTLNNHGFVIKKIQFVYPKIGEECNSMLIEAKKDKSDSNMKILEPLIVYDENGNYTKKALEIINQ